MAKFPALSETVALGPIVTLPDPRVLEIAGLAGSDWIFVDCEHGAVDVATLSRLLPAAGRVPTLVRIPDNSEIHVKQALDSGCTGVICPQVNDARTARDLVRWAKYPPLGQRSVGIGRAHGYGMDFPHYVASANETTTVVVQVESIAAAHNIDEILEVEGVDGVFIGPYDLSGSMGMTGQVEAPQVLKVIDEVISACKRHRTPVGQFFATYVAFQKVEHRAPLDFAAIGLDVTVLASGFKQLIDGARGMG